MMKRIVIGEVLANERIAEDVFRLTVRAEDADTARPGQFVNIYLDDKSILLPRPISICRVDGDVLTLVFRASGAGTSLLSRYRAGDDLKLSSPLGNGYYVKSEYAAKRALLVGGGVGIPPLLQLARALKGIGAHVTAVLGYRSGPFLADDFEAVCDQTEITTEDGTRGFRGSALAYLEKRTFDFDVAFACGPKPMLSGIANLCEKREIPLQVSLEERMGCGYGACVGCVCRIKVETPDGVVIENKRVCRDGPVFFAHEVVW